MKKRQDIFLPMASHFLNATRDELMRRLNETDESKINRKWDI
jgi:hypothetical protein